MSENKMRTHGSDLESLEILDLLLMLKNLLPDHAGLCSVTVVARRGGALRGTDGEGAVHVVRDDRERS